MMTISSGRVIMLVNALKTVTLLTVFLTGCGKSGTTPQKTLPVTPVQYKDPAQYGTPFAAVPDTKDVVMYEVNMQTYTPANFQGVSARLDSIKALGVNVIWLMPTYPIGVLKAVGSPYAVKDYTGVNASFGTLDDLRSLVAGAHSRNMAVILDWVADHTSWDNAWISNKAWYQQDASGNIIIPPGTNYADVAALNFNNSDMRTAMIRAMKYWVYTANVDGYRCDFADNIPTDFWKQALDTLNTIKTHKLIYLAEGSKSSELTAGFQMNFGFSFYGAIKATYAGTQKPAALFSASSSEIAAIPQGGYKLRYITNHDNASSDGSTLTVFNGKQGAISAFILSAFVGGVPLIYDSQEVGYPNAINFFTNVPVDYNANPDMVAAYKNILAFRIAHEAVKTGVLTTYDDQNMAVFEKKAGTDDVLIMVNVTNNTATYLIPAAFKNTQWKNNADNSSLTLQSAYTLPPYGYLILSR